MNMNTTFLSLSNGTAAAIAELPVLPMDTFRGQLIAAVTQHSMRVASFSAMPDTEQTGRFTLLAVLADDRAQQLRLAACQVSKSYPALSTDCPAFHWFEREIAENTGLICENHPWPKPLRFLKPANEKDAPAPLPGVTDYLRIEDYAAHEVAVGPVHAGVIEPGHFRFQCLGEEVIFLEISLGYQHRGIEKMLIGGPDARSAQLIECAAGDSSIASAWCYAQLLSALALPRQPSPVLDLWRGIALELERSANHCGDLGALAGDVAFLPTQSFCGRIRGDYLNMTAALCGNRFGRGYLLPHGLRYLADGKKIEQLQAKRKEIYRDTHRALELLFSTPSVQDRFENTAVLQPCDAAALGVVGVAGRASGLHCDVRSSHPYGPYVKQPMPICVEGAGDVLARAAVRKRELAASDQWLEKALDSAAAFSDKEQAAALAKPSTQQELLAPSMIAVSLQEAWRGQLCHVALTDQRGRFRHYKIVDPSFHNWYSLGVAMRGEQISHFPICNKSFNLSYCGHDL
jgi:Ni,Fe-hydrogenase III large subunit